MKIHVAVFCVVTPCSEALGYETLRRTLMAPTSPPEDYDLSSPSSHYFPSLDPNILLRTLFSDNLNLCSSLGVWEMKFHTHRNNRQFTFLDSERE
jgi:hypothetical protein